MKWLIARPEERKGCLAVERHGGSYSFTSALPFFSPTRCVQVGNTEFADSDMECLRPFNGMFAAELGGTAITERGLSCLLDCDALRYLFLRNTNLGDGIHRVLARMPNLEMLNLSYSGVSRKELEKVRETLPEAFISHEAGDFFREFTGDQATYEYLNAEDE